jgi:ribosomal protein S18 acetylase RimI-like enzyme
MIIKIIAYKKLTESNKEDIIRLMDNFLKPKKRKSIKEENIKRAIKQKNHTCVAAFEGKKIIGIITLIEENLFTAKLGLIDEAVVDESYRKKGVASEIMKEIIKIAKNRKLDLLKVDTNTGNPINYLYQKFGFIRRNDNLYKLFF